MVTAAASKPPITPPAIAPPEPSPSAVLLSASPVKRFHTNVNEVQLNKLC